MKQNERALDGLMDVIHSELSSGGNVLLTGFGMFSAADRGVRTAQNPKVGEETEVRIRKIPVFKARPTLRRAVNSR